MKMTQWIGALVQAYGPKYRWSSASIWKPGMAHDPVWGGGNHLFSPFLWGLLGK